MRLSSGSFINRGQHRPTSTEPSGSYREWGDSVSAGPCITAGGCARDKSALGFGYDQNP